MGGHPFIFVEDELNQKYSNLESISRPIFVKYLQQLTKKAEAKIMSLLPKKFCLIIDGWTDGGTSTHYLAIFAGFEDPKHQSTGMFPLLAFSPLLDEGDLTAQGNVILLSQL